MRASWNWCASVSSLSTIQRSLSRSPWLMQPSRPIQRVAQAGTATTETVMVTVPPMAIHGHLQGKVPVISGRCSQRSVASTYVVGNTIHVAATNTDNKSQTTVVSTTTRSDGSFSVSVPVTGGTTVLNTVAVSPAGNTAHDQRSIVFDFTPGKVVFDVTDPSNDDNGPGNYAYPTASDFHAGAFDILAFRVILSPDGSTVTFKLQTRDLSPTFGSPLGAQLVDVYVHNPGAASSDTSRAASFPQRNYAIDSSAAWSRLIEV